MRYKYTDEDIEFLKEYYPIGDWDKIHDRFKNLTDISIYHKCNRLGIKYNDEYRTRNTSKHKSLWTDEEIFVLKSNYSNMNLSDLQKLIPNRSKDSIKQKAISLNLVSFYDMNNSWKQDEIQYIIDNWELLPDVLMAQNINKTFRAVKWKREELGLYRQDMNSNSYPTLSKYLRGNNQAWKKESMKNCNYQCVLTGSKNFEIHHLYGVSNLINDIYKKHKDLENIEFNNYSSDDLNILLEEFLNEQAKHPLGVCIDKNIHVLFHSMYGQYYNTVEQWEQFKIDYLNGRYKNIAK